MDGSPSGDDQREVVIARELIKELPAGVIVTDLDGVVREWSGRCEEIFGYTAEEAIGQPVSFVHRPELRDAMTAEMIEAIAADGQFHGEVPCVRKDGVPIDIETTSKTLYDDDGRPIALIGINVDRTKRKRDALHTEQAQRMASLGRLAGGIAHDLNNVLMAARLGVDLANGALTDPQEAARHLDMVRESLESSTQLIRRLLEFSRQQVRPPQPVNLTAVLLGMRAMLDRTIGEGVTLDMALPREPIVVLGDPSELEQIVMNLVVNARDAGSSTVRVTAQTCAFKSGPYAAVSVRDNGSGISEQVQQSMFEPFFTTGTDGASSGLGLSIVYRIVEARGGCIDVNSEAGGTEVTIFLPLAEVAPDEVAPAQAHPTTVLLCEDNALLRRALRHALEARGLVVHATSGVDDALECFDRHRDEIDVVLSDVVMPGRSGADLALAILDRAPTQRFLFMTGHTDRTALPAHPKIADLPVLAKPLLLDELIPLLTE